jgi:hypothetical protein
MLVSPFLCLILLLVRPAAASTPSEIDLKLTCGAIGNGVSDDSKALKTCIDLVNTAYANHTPAYLHVPAGIYLIKNTNGAMPGFAVGVPGGVVGDGPNKSTIWLDAGYGGNVFSWSGASSTVDFPGDTVNPLDNLNTPLVSGLTIIGNLSASHQQNALMFYDLDDAVTVRDVEVYSMPGYCLSVGQTEHNSVAYVRESFFENLKCWNSGTSLLPAVAIGSTTSSTSDATNELSFYKLDVFHAASTGVAISNKEQWSATRLIKFFGLRIEDSAKDGLDIGLPTDSGRVQEIDIYDLDEPAVADGYYGVKVTTGGANIPYGINIRALQIGSGSGSGIDLDHAMNVLVQSTFATRGPNITLGAGAGANISFSSSGGPQPSAWTYAYGALKSYGDSLSSDASPAIVYGIPASADRAGTAVMEATTSSSAPATLTMDGAAPNGQNCFNPGYSQGYNLSIQLLAQDVTTPSKNYSWTMPIAYFNAWYGAGTATLSLAKPYTISNGPIGGTSVVLTADRSLGCLNLAFMPPSGNIDNWTVEAKITFVHSP